MGISAVTRMFHTVKRMVGIGFHPDIVGSLVLRHYGTLSTSVAVLLFMNPLFPRFTERTTMQYQAELLWLSGARRSRSMISEFCPKISGSR